MRLSCPTCGATYEVEDRLIPAIGRDVQCSACGQVWFHRPEPAAPPRAAAEAPAPLAPERTRRKPDPEVMRILREEAAREAAARRVEGGGLESQTDFDFAPPARRRTAAPDPMTVTGADPETRPEPERPAEPSRRTLLPEIDDVSTQLAGPDGAVPGTAPDAALPGAAARPEAVRRAGARRFGLGLALGLCAAAAGLYTAAAPLGRAAPPLAPALDTYVQTVDRGRLWLDRTVRSALPPGTGLRDLSPGTDGPPG